VRPKFEETLNLIGPHTNFIMLHARAKTVGGNESNFDNHPIIAHPIVGIHNGTLKNHDELFKQYELPREGEVDSELIFRLFGHLLEKGATPERAMKTAASQLKGAFTGAAVDLRHPHRMLMFRFQRSLNLLTFKHYDMIIAVSEVKLYDRARHKVGLRGKDHCTWIHDGAGFWLDVNEPGHVVKNVHKFRFEPAEGPEVHRLAHSRYLTGYGL
jgi:glucosamine 6-phosphate synthetase-like amidotransferase/phosphosugar isomerase protein